MKILKAHRYSVSHWFFLMLLFNVYSLVKAACKEGPSAEDAIDLSWFRQGYDYEIADSLSCNLYPYSPKFVVQYNPDYFTENQTKAIATQVLKTVGSKLHITGEGPNSATSDLACPELLNYGKSTFYQSCASIVDTTLTLSWLNDCKGKEIHTIPAEVWNAFESAITPYCNREHSFDDLKIGWKITAIVILSVLSAGTLCGIGFAGRAACKKIQENMKNKNFFFTDKRIEKARGDLESLENDKELKIFLFK